MMSVIHTIGDSTLDNLHWVLRESGRGNLEQAKEKTVEGRIQVLVGCKVSSHAYDGFTTKSLLQGDRVGRVLPWLGDEDPYIREKAGFRKEPWVNPRWVNPLKDLETEVRDAPHKIHFVVLSVGGNDFRENLPNPFRLVKDISQIQSRYLQILGRLKTLQESAEVRPILMLQYRTDANNDDVYRIYTVMSAIGVLAVATHLVGVALLATSAFALVGKISLASGAISFVTAATTLYFSRKITDLTMIKDVILGRKNIGMATLGKLIELFYRPILERASEDKIPVLDLPNTFDPYRRDLYLSGIEPSEQAANLIAEGVCAIVQDDYSRESRLYSKQPGSEKFSSRRNMPLSWNVAYPPKIIEFID